MEEPRRRSSGQQSNQEHIIPSSSASCRMCVSRPDAGDPHAKTADAPSVARWASDASEGVAVFRCRVRRAAKRRNGHLERKRNGQGRSIAGALRRDRTNTLSRKCVQRQHDVSVVAGKWTWSMTEGRESCCDAASTCAAATSSIGRASGSDVGSRIRKRAPARPGRNDSSGQDLKLRVEGGCGSRPASGEATGRDVRTATSIAGERRNASPVRPGLGATCIPWTHQTVRAVIRACFEMSFFSQPCAKPRAAWAAAILATCVRMREVGERRRDYRSRSRLIGDMA